MLLRDRTAVVYGRGGAIGGAVARAFGREGARVYLAGRTAATLDAVAEETPAGVDGRAAIVEGIERETMLGRAATLDDVGEEAAFAASDCARTITAASINVSCGALAD